MYQRGGRCARSVELETAEAFRYLDQGHAHGKVVIVVKNGA